MDRQQAAGSCFNTAMDIGGFWQSLLWFWQLD
jgi:hypothetical protein